MKSPPQHSWYKAKSPGVLVGTTLQRKVQTVISRLKTEPFRTVKIVNSAAEDIPNMLKLRLRGNRPQQIFNRVNRSTSDPRNKPTGVIK